MKVLQIEIMSVPPHQAPDYVKKAWVGLVLPVAQRYVAGTEGFVSVGLQPGTSMDSRNNGAYEVTIQDALAAMQEKNPEAAHWLRTKSILPAYDFYGNILFSKDCAEMVF